MNEMILTTLGHTWILDLDGTILKHNGYKTDGEDSFLPGAEEFLHSIPEKDMIIFVTSRNDEYQEITKRFLLMHNVRFNHIIFNAPYGERILINDDKPSGLKMGIAINKSRNEAVSLCFVEDKTL